MVTLICVRRIYDFYFTQSLKYWRFRMYAVPAIQPATKRLFEGYPYCDIYTSLPLEEHTPLKEGFLKFIESPINRIRRMNIQSSVGSRVSYYGVSDLRIVLTKRAYKLYWRQHALFILYVQSCRYFNILSFFSELF